MLTAPDLNTHSDAMRLDVPPPRMPALRLVPSNERPGWPPGVHTPLRPRPLVDEEDLDSMWDEPLCSW